MTDARQEGVRAVQSGRLRAACWLLEAPTVPLRDLEPPGSALPGPLLPKPLNHGLSLDFTDLDQIGTDVAMFPFDDCAISLPGQITPQRLVDLPIGANNSAGQA